MALQTPNCSQNAVGYLANVALPSTESVPVPPVLWPFNLFMEGYRSPVSTLRQAQCAWVPSEEFHGQCYCILPLGADLQVQEVAKYHSVHLNPRTCPCWPLELTQLREKDSILATSSSHPPPQIRIETS